ncbi:helix-turn-helix transcriptional regulator [Streptomyces sp. NPDC093252]|uniref:helix-turn-helix domain-containing protein n=1 Tax=Streptomyces sp. NPDC093252 TaxID=3154980 RepID=UPI00343E6F9E
MTQNDIEDEETDDIPEWADRVNATVAREVRRRRKEMRWSAQDLADACERLGHPIPRNVIANMESGRRAHLPLADVMILAAALRTYPICLIYPVGYTDQTQELPFEEPVPTRTALRHFTADKRITGHDPGMLRDFDTHTRLTTHALTALAENDNNSDDAITAKYELRHLRRRIRERGATPPHLPHTLHDVDQPTTVPTTPTGLDNPTPTPEERI